MSVIIKFNDLPQLIDQYPDEVADGIEAAAREGEGFVKRIISESPASGNVYGSHTASSPGNPPRIDTGNLVNSINAKRINDHLWSIQVGAEYAKVLEFGGRHVSARPFMGPMAIWLEDEIEPIVRGFVFK